MVQEVASLEVLMVTVWGGATLLLVLCGLEEHCRPVEGLVGVWG
jgi:hypothetical protein